MNSFERDLALEREVILTAGRSEGKEPAAANLRDFADARAHEGPVLMPEGRSLKQEAFEELADAANYLSWWITQNWEGVLAGESVACRDYEQAMRALSFVVKAHDALLLPAS